MAQQGIFTLPAGIKFGATALVNSSANQTITVLVDGVTKATFNGSGSDKNLGTQTIDSGRGAVKVTVSANNKASDLVSTQVILANKLNCALLGSEDSTDYDYNDAIVLINWPIG